MDHFAPWLNVVWYTETLVVQCGTKKTYQHYLPACLLWL